ncbi:thioredoxin family protein [Planctomicrobium piriforme]|uniref:Thioredoxin-like domain-containing protein n=1 Tax=Planctomicrobium piriforme TaxID=1576369 RepID=A0A1I3QIL9_9PLAN|nr:thioredoxin family protein [Planctomicrobium piriforme]SFJ33898.1 Thioredoxin-like domain-containing protein [Planctomicrobium piriforme]
MRRDFCPVVCLALWGALNGSVAFAGNFACDDAEIVAAAEHARLRSANFWQGKPLPGDWSSPCPIRVSRCADAGGQTQFSFDQGEVFGWKMLVAGSRSAILRDVIPHEVDHMVRASLVRRPIERWLDEGCAALLESESVHLRLRTIANGIDPSLFSASWLERQHYPVTTRGVEELYAGGFSLVEFLLTKSSPGTLLAFQQSSGSIAARLQQHYQLTPEKLPQVWSAWRAQRKGTSCTATGCLLHPAQANAASESGRPKLTVWTAAWCPACQAFRSDLAQVPNFRETLGQQFQIQFVDFNQHAGEAQREGITLLPTFVTSDHFLTGYQGADDLLRRLGIAVSPSPNAEQKPPPQLPAASLPMALEQPAPATPPPQPAIAPKHLPAGKVLELVPVALTILQWAGVIGGTVATGGLGGIAVAGAMFLLRRRATRASSSKQGGTAGGSAPFPRQLDEACELLAVGQSEGRVAVLDALRGLFLDDELEKLANSTDPAKVKLAGDLRTAIDARVDEVAPLTTTFSDT